MLVSTIKLAQGDLPAEAIEIAKATKFACLDIETSGLDYRASSIGSIQILIADVIYIIRPPYVKSNIIRDLLADDGIKKIFHHAMFDLRFIKYHIGGLQKNIACTKIASKIVSPERQEHSLASLVQENFETKLQKEMRLSDWTKKELTPAQINYAAADVAYLERLLNLLQRSAVKKKRMMLVRQSFQYVPIRVDLDIIGSGDVFVY